MRSILPWLLALAACGGASDPPLPPAPIVSALAPQTGPWGTQVTIDGANFGPATGTGVVAFAGSVGANGFVVDTWDDREIRGRVAFPATGEMTVQTRAGQGSAGTFTTTAPWSPSAPIDVAKPIAGLVLSTGKSVGLFHEYELGNHATLAVFGGGNAGAYLLDEVIDPLDASARVVARLVEADDHTPAVIATRRDRSVVLFGVHAAALTTTATGLVGDVVAAGRDATGLYAWIATAAGLARARPGATWTIDRGPFAAAAAPLDGAIAPDGTLWIVVGEPAAASQAYVAIQTLAPAATQLGAFERVDPVAYAAPLSRAQLALAGDGVHALVTATAAGATTALAPRLRSAAATWADAPAPPGIVQYAFVGATLGAIVNDAATRSTSFVPDVAQPATAQPIPVWPVLSESVVVDAAGKLHPMVTNGTVTYALTPS